MRGMTIKSASADLTAFDNVKQVMKLLGVTMPEKAHYSRLYGFT